MKMKQVYFITENESKFKEARLILQNIKLVMKDLKLEEPKTLDQEQVVKNKAEQAFQKLKKPVIVDDTGIYFSEYKIFPGTYTKTLFQAIGFKGVEKLLDKANRDAYFKTIICYKDGKTEEIFFGIWKGKIVKEISKKFNPDWEYNSIFVPQNFNKPLSEISLQERAKFSHRKKALAKLAKFLGGKNAKKY
ncbi:non-canonical purine NTP pyrophosphatase [Candidatus Pacearchaeota archaeon]|nr:non-canonical purine NTP pyrophosphatase [Candidatus Pacearchaeota archaeon]